MMEEKDIFYHIHKNGIHDEEWKIGNVINIDQNDFIRFSLNYSIKQNIPGINNESYRDEVIRVQKLCDINEQSNLLSNSIYIINEYQLLIRELAFEEIRQKEFNHLPSRQKCIWLCRKDQLKFWIRNLESKDYTVFKIEIYGRTFKTRDFLIPSQNDSYNEMLEKARQYWQYNNDEDYEDDEYLYEGNFKIIDSVPLSEVS